MTTPQTILLECQRRRIRLTPAGANITAQVAGKLPVDIERALMLHKPAILKLLTAKRHLAKQILLDEFSILDGKLFHKLYVEMASNHLDPVCRRALDHLRETIRTTNRR